MGVHGLQMFLCVLLRAPIPPVSSPVLAVLDSLLLAPLRGRLKGTQNLALQSFPWVSEKPSLSLN